MATNWLDHIECSVHPLDLSFHPKRDNVLAAALVDGTLEIHDIRPDEDDEVHDDGPDSILSSTALHSQMIPEKDTGKSKPASCRTVEFSMDGQRLYTGGSAGDLCAVDAERVCSFSTNPQNSVLWRVDNASTAQYNPLLVVKPFEDSSSLLATGDDSGGVRLWDERMLGKPSTQAGSTKRPQGCVLSWEENSDYISGIEHSSDGNTVLASSADGRLSIFDLRMARDPNKSEKSVRLSDDQEDELLSLKIIKNGKKVICGTQEGVLSVFSWGTWGDCSDRFPGHPSSIDTLLKVDEDTLLTGSSDGWIRVVQIHPDKLLGVLGENHGGLPVEKLAFNSTRDIVGSISHDNNIRLWNSSVLKDGNDDDDEEEDDDEPASTEAKASAAVATGNGSDDDWSDMDDNSDGEDDDDEDSDDDSDEEEVVTVNDQRKKRLKTENEKFFDDL